MSDIRIKDVMTKNAIFVDGNSPVKIAAEIMTKNRIGSLIVNGETGPVGIITESDIIKKVVSQNANIDKTKVSEIMTAPMIFATPEQKITDAAAIMISNRIRRLPILSNNKIVGIITHTDIVRASPAMILLLEERLKMREPEPSIPSREVRVHIGSRAGICDFCGKCSLDLSMFDEEWCCQNCLEEKHELHKERKHVGFKDWSRMS